jgi:hypothetical protein
MHSGTVTATGSYGAGIGSGYGNSSVEFNQHQHFRRGPRRNHR